MKLRIEIDMDNVAFDDFGSECEVARILREFAIHTAVDGTLHQDYTRVLRDPNGNTVGKVEVVEG